jgi:AhpD family alkylhydroperoxidase
MRVVVVNARGLHLGYVSACGNEWIETPALDRLAAEGVVFDIHVADRPDAAGARRAWRTGRYDFPSPEGTAAAPEPPDLIRLLKDAGVVTSLVLDAGRASPSDFADGWDVVMEAEPDEDATALEYVLEGAGQAMESLAETDGWLLWLELATLLPPWEVPAEHLDRYLVEYASQDEEADEEDEETEALEPLLDPPSDTIDPGDDLTFIRLQRSYAAAVSYLDAALGALLKELEARRLLDDVLLIVTTDHGLPLGEHGAVGVVRPWLHDELVHLPLLMRLPRGEQAGRHVWALTQPVDLMPTLLDAFGLPPAPAQGHDLLPLARGAVEKVRDYACTGLRIDDAVEWALRSPEWAFLLPAGGESGRLPRLYAKPDDRWELNDVIQHHPELAEHLAAVLREFVAATRRPGPLRPPELRDVEAEETKPTDPSGGPTVSTVKLVDENTDNPRVRAVFEDIKATKKIDRVPNIWRALATHPEHLELCWTRLKAIMSPGKLDVLTKEIIALAVSATNGCDYCINSHTAAVQKLGLDNEGLGEVLAVVGLYNQMNKLADAYQVEPDILPKHS